MSQTSDTMTVNVQSEKPVKRIAIVGTAPSWRHVPWKDTTLQIAGLNDAHVLGWPRMDLWFDLHRFSEMVFGATTQPEVPVGAYARPKGHLDWLRTRTCPVFLQEPPPAGWTHAHQFPIAEILAFWQKFWPWRVDAKGIVTAGKDYETSTPALMLMWAVWAGYTEIHVYGIHLATEWEYLSQRPNMEMLIGIAAGLGIKIVLPDKTPICKGKFRYAYEPKADLPVQAVQRTIDAVKAEGQRLRQKATALPWYARGRKRDLQDRLTRLDVQLLDARHQFQKQKMRAEL